MLTYSFTNTGSDSMYEYLYKCIRNDITQGKIKAGEKLPSKRTFAKNLGISVITVENAYGQLLAEGYIYSMPKRGFYVSDLSSATMEKKKVRKEQLTLTGGATSYFADFSSNQTDSEIFPFTIWSKTVREVLNDNQKQLMIDPGAATGDCPVFKGVPCHAGRAGTDHHRSGDRISAWTSDTASWKSPDLWSRESGLS